MTGAAMTGKHLVLIGLMGAGKTTVGAECAQRLGRTFVDTDDLVVSTAHMTVEGIFADGGEPRFRQLEHVVVADVSASPEPLVIACGGGTVLDADGERNADLRIGRDGRIEAVGPALARLVRLREPAYEAAAHACVDTDDLDVAAVADAVLSVFEGAPA